MNCLPQITSIDNIHMCLAIKINNIIHPSHYLITISQITGTNERY